METVFLKILNMSLSAAVVTAAVLLVRLLLQSAPRKWSYLLWSAVGFRLAMPVTLRTVFSLFRLAPIRPAEAGSAALTYIPADIGTMARPQVSVASPGVREALSGSLPAATPFSSVNPLQVWIAAGTVLWCAGLTAMLLWGVVSYVRLRRRLVGAVRREDNVYESDRISVPFLLGLVRPRIYIPLGLDEETLGYVLAHERYHIRRGDPWVKCLAFLLLALHWFNPFVWLAFCLMGRDMEMSCDEKVLAEREGSAKLYSLSLLSFAAARHFPSPAPLAFGETGVKGRIRNALRWKKPRPWVTVLAALLCIAVLAACATNPPETEEDISSIGGAGGPEEIHTERSILEADLDGDGSPEKIVLHDLGDGDCQMRVLSGADSAVLFMDELSISHAGWKSWYLCTLQEGAQLLCYTPSFGTGIGEYRCELYTFSTDSINSPFVSSFDVSFSVAPGQVELPAQEMADFAERVNALLENSTLLVSTRDGVMTVGPAETEPETFAVLDELAAPDQVPGTEAGELKRRLETFEKYFRVYWTEDAAEETGHSVGYYDPDSGRLVLVILPTEDEAALVVQNYQDGDEQKAEE